MTIKKLLKLLFPTIVVKLLERRNSKISWHGNFKSWQDASLMCTNYSNKKLLKQLVSARKNVLNGTSVYERDGINFESPKYELEIYSLLQSIFIKQKSLNVNVLDFGGALGSTCYAFSHYTKLTNLNINMSWSIVKQKELLNKQKIF